MKFDCKNLSKSNPFKYVLGVCTLWIIIASKSVLNPDEVQSRLCSNLADLKPPLNIKMLNLLVKFQFCIPFRF